MKVEIYMPKSEQLRAKILKLTGEYTQLNFEKDIEFIECEPHVPVSGKLIGKEEIQYAVDASLIR